MSVSKCSRLIADYTSYIRRTYIAELYYNPDGTIQPLGVIPRPATATTQEAKP